MFNSCTFGTFSFMMLLYDLSRSINKPTGMYITKTLQARVPKHSRRGHDGQNREQGEGRVEDKILCEHGGVQQKEAATGQRTETGDI